MISGVRKVGGRRREATATMEHQRHKRRIEAYNQADTSDDKTWRRNVQFPNSDPQPDIRRNELCRLQPLSRTLLPGPSLIMSAAPSRSAHDQETEKPPTLRNNCAAHEGAGGAVLLPAIKRDIGSAIAGPWATTPHASHGTHSTSVQVSRSALRR